MKVLLVSGLGPEYKSNQHLEGTLFDSSSAKSDAQKYLPWAGEMFDFKHFARVNNQPLLRPLGGTMPHLTTSVLKTILTCNGYDPVMLPLEDLWTERICPGRHSFDAVLLSTTFICNRGHLERAIQVLLGSVTWKWLILGGQYTNLKFSDTMRQFKEVDFVVSGDAEFVLPRLLSVLDGGGDIASVPNLVYRCPGIAGVAMTDRVIIEADNLCTPDFEGSWEYIPYESMRGCPFHCRFCAYPAASPQWRYRSAARVFDDWIRYAERNGCRHIKSMDSTFTVPTARFTEILRLLPGAPVTWEAYTRANAIRDRTIVQGLEAARCRELSIGLESMSRQVLDYMKKQVSVESNRQAVDLLWDSTLFHRCSFMIGYPGETPDEYYRTQSYLERDFKGWYMLSVFSFLDETMPVWNERERFGLEFDDEQNPAYSWRHTGMDVHRAFDLYSRTMTSVRRRNEDAVMISWQPPFVRPLCPEQDKRANLRVEKLIEKLAFLPVDFPDPTEGRAMGESYRYALSGLGIEYVPNPH